MLVSVNSLSDVTWMVFYVKGWCDNSQLQTAASHSVEFWNSKSHNICTSIINLEYNKIL